MFNLNEKNVSPQRREYIARINRALDYIETRLAEPLTLAEIASTANFSEFHFARLFKAFIGESLYQYVLRLRMERSALALCKRQEQSVMEIGFDYGYTSPSAFSKAFKSFFGVSPSEWRENPIFSKNGKENSKNDECSAQKSYNIARVINAVSTKQIWSLKMENNSLAVKVEVRYVEAMKVAYVRHIGPYKGDEKLFEGLFGKLFGWAGPRGMIRFPETKMLTIYHDNPELVEDDKLRISVCITVPDSAKADGEIGIMNIPEGKYAVADFEILPTQYGDAWEAVYSGWLPESGYVPDDRLCFEMYHNDPKTHPDGKHIVSIFAPVKPL
ncbi:MAG: transcriptional regulator, AraC family [Ignavibacteria bacterium]|nr:transcriptional regulator, AraC family [Ignavibacteria bacterium]